MAQLKSYPEYKESTVEWLGSIPSQWDIIKLKHLVSIVTGNTPPKSNEENYTNGIYSWVKPDNFNLDYTISETKEKLSEKGVKLARVIPGNSALVCSIGTVGKVAVNNEPVTTNQQINSIVFDKDKWISDYGIYAVISAEDEFKKHANKVVISILNKTSQGNIFMPLPSINEQKSIGHYIKLKTIEIDNLLSEKKRLIELLEEKRQAVITQTVTKGLDPNVKMKDTGIELIGEMPEHWTVKKLKYLCNLNPSKSEVSKNEDFTVTFIPMENLKSSGEVDYSLNRKISDVYKGYTYFKEKDIIMAKVTPCFENGNLAVATDLINGIGFGTTELHVLRASSSIKTQFLYYVLRSERFRQEAVSSMYGVAGLKRIPTRFISDFKIGLPNINEQERIIEHISKKNKETNKLIDLQREIISKLKEYRESLIYEAVTGKIDVRDYVSEMEEVY